jgi:hypothetical protein
MFPLGIQNKLLAHKFPADDPEFEAPEKVGADVVMLRKTLDLATQAFFHCEAGDDTNPASLQAKLAAFLHADRSKRDENSTAQDGVYGANLKIKVEQAKGLENSLFVVLNFGINCGDDNILLLFTKEDNQWKERLHWYSDKYTAPTDAFGDLYLYSVVPGKDGGPLLVVAHGRPWCVSRWSSFELNLLSPATNSTPQANLGHFTAGDDRASDNDSGIKPVSDGFTFKFWTNEAVTGKHPTSMSEPLTLRFRTTGNTLLCVSKDCPKQSDGATK